MKVLWISERFPPDRGGVAVSAAREARLVAPNVDRIDVVRLVSELPPGQVSVEDRDGLSLHRVGRSEALDESLQLLAQASAHLLAAHRHDLVHGFGAVHAGYVATTVAREAGVPSVVSLRGNDVERAMFNGSRFPFLLWTLREAHSIIAVSAALLARARAVGGDRERMHVVRNGVDSTLFRPDGPVAPEPAPLAGAPRPWIAFAGEMRMKKGLPILLDLAARLRTGTVVLLGGVRDEERATVAAWRRRAPEAGPRLRELEYERDPARLASTYRMADLFAFPSLWDGLPNALLEAMACGKAVVASAVGGIPEVIEPGRSGLLVPPDRLDRFADEVISLASAPPEERERLGRGARERVERDFGLAAEAEGLLAVYRSCVARR